MIPEAAVEAAAIIAELRLFNHHKAADFLEAAAPHMPSPDAASVWDEAVTVLYMGKSIDPDQLQAMYRRNPYRTTK